MSSARFSFRRQTVWPFVLAGTITVCSGFPAAVPEAGWFEPDKAGHFAAYGALATAILRHPALVSRRALAPWVAFLLTSAYGLGDEFRQSLTGGIRTFDLADWVADTVGAAVAVLLYARWSWYRRTMERPLLRRKSSQPRVEISSGSLTDSRS